MGKITQVDTCHCVCVPVSSLSSLSLVHTVQLCMADTLLVRTVSLLFRINPYCLEHPLIPIKLGVVAERSFRYPDAAGKDIKRVIVFRLSERWKLLGTIPAPVVEEVECQGGEGAENRI